MTYINTVSDILMLLRSVYRDLLHEFDMLTYTVIILCGLKAKLLGFK